jgi:hypothetical protein
LLESGDLRERRAMLAHEVARAHGNAMAVDGALDAVAGTFVNIVRLAELEAPRLGVVHERLSDDVRGELIDRGGKAQELVGAVPVERDDPLDCRSAQGEGAGLVQQDGSCVAKLLDHRRALDHHARPGSPGDSRHQCDRDGEDERARRRDDEDRERTHGIAAQRPGGGGKQHRRRQQDRGVAVGHPHERRALGARLLDEVDDRRVGALRGRSGSA